MMRLRNMFLCKDEWWMFFYDCAAETVFYRGHDEGEDVLHPDFKHMTVFPSLCSRAEAFIKHMAQCVHVSVRSFLNRPWAVLQSWVCDCSLTTQTLCSGLDLRWVSSVWVYRWWQEVIHGKSTQTKAVSHVQVQLWTGSKPTTDTRDTMNSTNTK